jgi:zinc transport system substrate-binding protein
MLKSRLATLLLLFLLSSVSGAGERTLQSVVSVLPQRTLMERVGGDRVQVLVLVQPGQSPHGYEPTPRQVAELSQAQLYVRIGAPFEDAWLPRLRAVNPALRVLDLRAGLRLRDQVGAEHDDEAEQDSHIWTSPPLLSKMAAEIRDALSELAPELASEFHANYSAFAADMVDLDQEIRERLSKLSQRRFLAYHPAWGHFAETYGLTQVPIERLGKEPGPKAMNELIRQARGQGVRLVLVQPQFNRKAANQVARAIDGRVAVVDPLSPDLAGTLRRLTDLLVEAGR